MQAAEWLSWQILCDAADLLLNSGDLSALEEAAERFFIDKESVSTILTWAPQKMAFDGCEMHSTAPGAHQRNDFYLSALNRRNNATLQLCQIYHTTNFPPHTTSGETTIPETRLLATGPLDILQFVDEAVAQNAMSLHTQRHLVPRPRLATLPLALTLVQQASDVDSDGSIESHVTAYDWPEYEHYCPVGTL